MSFLSFTYTFHTNTLIDNGLVKDCDMLCIIVLFGTLTLLFAASASTLTLIWLLCSKDLDDASNKDDAEKTEFGLEKAGKELSSNICTIGSCKSIPDASDATSKVGYIRLVEKKETSQKNLANTLSYQYKY